MPPANRATGRTPDRWTKRSSNTGRSERARECPHVALRARYADLAREIGELWSRDQPVAKVDRPRTSSQLAARSYIEAVEAGLAMDAFISWQWLERALDIVSLIKDVLLIDRAKTAAFDFQRGRNQAGDQVLWWGLDDIMAGSNNVTWTEQERAEGCELLRRRLDRASDISGMEFDPYTASGAADRLARWVEADEKVAALLAAGGAFEAMAAKADGRVARGFEPALPRSGIGRRRQSRGRGNQSAIR